MNNRTDFLIAYLFGSSILAAGAVTILIAGGVLVLGALLTAPTKEIKNK